MDDPTFDYYDLNYTYYYYDYGNFTLLDYYESYWKQWDSLSAVSYVIAWIVIWIGLPSTVLAIYALYSLVRDDHVAPVYVINLLISDLIQIFCLVIWVVHRKQHFVIFISTCIYYTGVLASVGFMVCVSLERYFVIACPLWYRFKRSIKLSVIASIIVWALSIIQFCIALLTHRLYHVLVHCVFLLLPFPVLIFSLTGTLKALSNAISVSVKDKKRIVGTLVLVLLNYTVLFLPSIIQDLQGLCGHTYSNDGLHLQFLQFSPLADLVLYIFMKRGTADKLLACLCCCKLGKEEDQSQDKSSTEKTTNDVSSV